MTDFEDAEASAYRGGTITLYRFQVDETKFFRYTDSEKDYTYDEEVFTAIPISSGDVTSTTLLDANPYEINVPKTCDLAEFLKGYPPSYVMRAEVFLLHPEMAANDRRRVFVGKLIGISTKGAEAVILADTMDSSFRNPGLRRTYQRQCPHVLYGPQCHAVKVALPLVVLPLSAGLNTLALDGFPIEDNPDFYIGGQAEWVVPFGRVVRNIIGAYRDVSTIRLSLAGPADTAEIGGSVSIYRGCERTEASCTTRFNNILNYGGQPWIPLKNPIQSIATYL